MSAKITVGYESDAALKAIIANGDNYCLRLSDLVPISGLVSYTRRNLNDDKRTAQRRNFLEIYNVALLGYAAFHDEVNKGLELLFK